MAETDGPRLRDRLLNAWQATGPVLVGVIVGFVCLLAGPDRPPIEFYGAAAQIIPVLMLTLAIETQIFSAVLLPGLPRRRPRASWFDRFLDRHPWLLPLGLTALIMLLMTIGELAALNALAADDPGGDPSSLYFSLGFGVSAIATIPAWRLSFAEHPHKPTHDG